MTKRLREAQPFARFVDEHLADQVEHFFPSIGVIAVARRLVDVSVKRLAIVSHVAPTRRLLVPLQATPTIEILDSCLQAHSTGQTSQDALHHGQVLPIVMGLEQRVPHGQFENYAPDAPNIAGLRPAQFQDDFGSPVVSGGDYGTVVLMIKGG